MSDLYLYLMCSRNKDNKEIKGFKKRSKTILEYSFNEDKIEKMFEKFTAEGVLGEKTRLYRSVNSRNIMKIKEDLIIYLLKDHSYSSLTNINKVIASISEKKENRDESKWMFDFDEKNEDLANNFINDIEHIVTSGKINSNIALPAYKGIQINIEKYKTPNGFAIIVEHGFDTRELMEKWKDYDVTLKKDALLFLDMKEKSY